MKKERYFSVLIGVVCAVWLFESQGIRAATMPGVPGPRFFPYLVMGCLFGFAVIQFALSFRSPKKAEIAIPIQVPVQSVDTQEDSNAEGEGGCIDPDELTPDRKSLIASFILIFLYVIGIDQVGFYTATVPAVFFCLWIARKGKTPWYKLIPGTALITGVIYGVFSLALQVSLPMGKIW